MDLAAVEDPAGGYPGLLEDLHGVLRVLAGGPGGQDAVDLVVPAAALVEGQAGQILASDDRGQRPPLAVGRHRDHQPLVLPRHW